MAIFTKERNGSDRIITIFGYRFKYTKKRKAPSAKAGTDSFVAQLVEARIAERYHHPFQNIQPGDICIDCGCNAGAISDIFLSKRAVLHAFEPHPYLFGELERKYSGNPDVHLSNKAVWDRHTAMDFHIETTGRNKTVNLEGTSLFKRIDAKVEAKYKVEVIDLVEYISALGKRVAILKIDVEGAEFEIIAKIISSGIHAEIDHIFCETHPQFFPDGEERLASLEEQIAELGITNIHLDWA